MNGQSDGGSDGLNPDNRINAADRAVARRSSRENTVSPPYPRLYRRYGIATFTAFLLPSAIFLVSVYVIMS